MAAAVFAAVFLHMKRALPRFSVPRGGAPSFQVSGLVFSDHSAWVEAYQSSTSLTNFKFTEEREGVIAGYQGSNIFETHEWFANLYDTLQKGFFRYPTMPMAPEVEAQKGDIVKADLITYVYRLISCTAEQFDALEAELHANLNNAGLNEIIEARGAYWDIVAK